MPAVSRAGRVVIAGGSGFLGVSLATHLASLGGSVVLLSRNPPRPAGPWRHVRWDARSLGDWSRELDGAIGVVNLAGRSVDCTFPASSWMVRVGAPLVMRTDPELALYGRRVVSKRLEDEQFAFRFPELREALADLLS